MLQNNLTTLPYLSSKSKWWFYFMCIEERKKFFLNFWNHMPLRIKLKVISTPISLEFFVNALLHYPLWVQCFLREGFSTLLSLQSMLTPFFHIRAKIWLYEGDYFPHFHLSKQWFVLLTWFFMVFDFEWKFPPRKSFFQTELVKW